MLWIPFERFIIKMMDISIQAAVIFCVLIMVRAIFSLCKIPKKYSCFLWVILFIRLILPVQIESPIGIMEKNSLTASSVERFVPIELSIYSPQEMDAVIVPETDAYNVPASDTSNSEVEVWPVLTMIWGVGFAGFLLYGIISYGRLKKKLQCSIKSEDNCYLTDGISMAFVIGFFSPHIYLPSDIAEEDMFYVTLHEKTHICRKDYLMKLVAYTITCFYWFHPFVWAGLFFLSKDMEMACDEAVMGKLGGDSRAAYADTLLRLSSGKYYFGGVPLAFGEGDTESRIRHIMKYKKPVIVAVAAAVCIISVLAAVLLTARPDSETDSQTAGLRADMQDTVPKTDMSDSSDTTNLFQYALEIKDGVFSPREVDFFMSMEEVLQATGLNEYTFIEMEEVIPAIGLKEYTVIEKDGGKLIRTNVNIFGFPNNITIDYGISDAVGSLLTGVGYVTVVDEAEAADIYNLLYEQAVSTMPEASGNTIEGIKDGIDVSWEDKEQNYVRLTFDKYSSRDDNLIIIHLSIEATRNASFVPEELKSLYEKSLLERINREMH